LSPTRVDYYLFEESDLKKPAKNFSFEHHKNVLRSKHLTAILKKITQEIHAFFIVKNDNIEHLLHFIIDLKTDSAKLHSESRLETHEIICVAPCADDFYLR
jgi:hypothetical protein